MTRFHHLGQQGQQGPPRPPKPLVLTPTSIVTTGIVICILVVVVPVSVMLSRSNEVDAALGWTDAGVSGGDVDTVDTSAFLRSLEATRQKFANLYGGEKEAMEMLNKAIIAYHDGELGYTAERLLTARASSRPFVMSFGGYSVTAGRGNRHEQSFPFIVESVLRQPLKELGIDLVVRNAGLGAIPALPFGWCLSNFLGSDADLVSWDFRFNEGSDSSSFESYLRHAMNLPKSPKLMLMAKRSPSRKRVLKDYTRDGSLIDSIVVNNSYPPNSAFLQLAEDEKPPGFASFDKWGAPDGSPGQEGWNPKYKWHMMIGWIIGMHILEAAEIAEEMITMGEGEKVEFQEPGKKLLPKPTNDPGSQAAPMLLFGEPLGENDDEWALSSTHCSTTFTPTVEGIKLVDLVVSGLQGEADVAEEAEFRQGWVFGFSSRVARDEHNRYTQLGFRDTKRTLHGLHTSGPLKMWIPWDATDESSRKRQFMRSVEGTGASTWFQSLVICQFYDSGDKTQCSMEKDAAFAIGGVTSTDVSLVSSVGTRWQEKDLCVHVGVPSDATISKRGASGSRVPGDTDDVGITLEIRVTNDDLAYAHSPCSLSHVVWQHARR